MDLRTWKFVAAIAAVLVVTVGAWMGWNAWQGTDPGEQGRDAAMAFLAQIREGNIDAAWQETTAEFKSFMGRDRLHAFVSANPMLKAPAQFRESANLDASPLQLVEYRFTPERGSGLIRVVLAPEKGDWRVERLHVE